MNCLIKSTTKEERENFVKKALAISISGADLPTTKTMKDVRMYIEGKRELKDIQEKIIEEYREDGR